jgi:phage baseplate assembly protein gpV
MNKTNLSDLHVAGSQVDHDRAWWRVATRRLGSDWRGILRLQTEAVADWHDPDGERVAV